MEKDTFFGFPGAQASSGGGPRAAPRPSPSGGQKPATTLHTTPTPNVKRPAPLKEEAAGASPRGEGREAGAGAGAGGAASPPAAPAPAPTPAPVPAPAPGDPLPPTPGGVIAGGAEAPSVAVAPLPDGDPPEPPKKAKKAVRWVDETPSPRARAGGGGSSPPEAAPGDAPPSKEGRAGTELFSILKGGPKASSAAGARGARRQGPATPSPGAGTKAGYRMEGLEAVRVFDQFEECSAVERGDTTSQASEGAPRGPGAAGDLHAGWAEARRREREKEKQAMGEIQARSRVVLEDFNARFDALEGDGEEWIVPAALALPEAVLDMDAGRRDIISRGLIDGSGEDVDQVFSRNPAECLQRGQAPAYKTYVLCLPLEERQALEWRESGAPGSQYESYMERWQRRQQQQQQQQQQQVGGGRTATARAEATAPSRRRSWASRRRRRRRRPASSRGVTTRSSRTLWAPRSPGCRTGSRPPRTWGATGAQAEATAAAGGATGGASEAGGGATGTATATAESGGAGRRGALRRRRCRRPCSTSSCSSRTTRPRRPPRGTATGIDGAAGTAGAEAAGRGDARARRASSTQHRQGPSPPAGASSPPTVGDYSE